MRYKQICQSSISSNLPEPSALKGFEHIKLKGQEEGMACKGRLRLVGLVAN
jgi:hypothetical protein